MSDGTTATGDHRWAQLTYASFDAGTGAGGWQIKETTGALTDQEREALRARVVTAFDAHVELPHFPTAEQVAELPRRFTYAPLPGGGSAYWHAVQSGNDSTGRPGNVFTHAVLDRDPANPGEPIRPIQLWQSPDLLTPFGAELVLQSRLGASAFPSAGPISTAAVLEFIGGDWRQISFLCVLADAVSAALDGGPGIALLARSVGEVAMWVGAVSHLMSPATARTLSWSLYERASGIEEAFDRGIRLVGVPLADATVLGASADRIVVLEVAEQPQLGQAGGAPHVTAAGSRIPATEWSEMIQMVMLDPELAGRALQGVDDVSRAVGDLGLAPAWPLAMTTVLLGKDAEDAAPAAAEVILESSPDWIRGAPELYAASVEVVGTVLGSSAADAWAALAELPADGSALVRELVGATYYERIMDDPGWLTQPGGVPMPTGLALTAETAARLKAKAVRAVDREYAKVGAADSSPILLLRLVDTLVRAGLLEEGLSTEKATDALEQVVAPILLDIERGPDLVRTVGDVGVQLIDGPLREALLGLLDQRGDPGIGRLAAPPVIDWLTPDGASSELLRATVSDSRTGTVLEREIGIRLVHRGIAPPGTAAVIVKNALDNDISWSKLPADLRALLPPSQWGSADLVAVESFYPEVLPRPLFAFALATEPWSDDLQMLVGTVAEPASEGNLASIASLARVRRSCAMARLDRLVDRENDEALGELAARLFTRFGAEVRRDEIALLALPAMTLAVAARANAGGHAQWADAIAFYGGATTVDLAAKQIGLRLGDRASAGDLALLALRTHPNCPPTAVDAVSQAIGRIRHPNGGRLVEYPLRAFVAGQAGLVDSVVADVEQRMQNLVFSLNRDRADEKRLIEVEKFARGWWRDLGVPDRRQGGNPLLGVFRLGEKKER